LLNFLKRSKDISSKLILGLCQLHQQRKPSLFTTLAFKKKSRSNLSNLTKKRPSCIIFFKNRDQIKTKKKLEDQLHIFKLK